MRVLFAAAAAAALLAGCQQQGAGNEAAGNDAAPSQPSGNGAAVAGAGPLGAAVTGDQASKLMHDRHEGMEDIGDAMKALTSTLKADSPDLAVVRSSAASFTRYAPQVTGWFPPGTGPDVGKTRAKAEIWQKPEDFAAKARDFQQAVRAFDAAAQGGDVAAIRAAHGDLGKACKACHDPYRAPEH